MMSSTEEEAPVMEETRVATTASNNNVQAPPSHDVESVNVDDAAVEAVPQEEFIDEDDNQVDQVPAQEIIMDRNDNDDPKLVQVDHSLMASAGILTGLLSCLACGPLAGCVLGASAAIGTARPTAAGDVARAVGRTGLHCAACSRRRATHLDQEHLILDRVQQSHVYQQTAAWSNHPVVHQTRDAAAWTFAGVRHVDATHGITQKSWRAVHAALNAMHGVVMGVKPGEVVQDPTDVSLTATDVSIGSYEEEGGSSSSSSNRNEEPHDSKDDPVKEKEPAGKDMRQGFTKRGGYAAVEGGEIVMA